MTPSKHGKFSEGQAITASAASTNVLWLDSVATQNGKAPGRPLWVKTDVTEAFNNLTSLDIRLDTSDDGESWVSLCGATVVKSQIDDLAALRVPSFGVADCYKKAVRLYYTVTGSAPTTGKVNASLVTAVPASNDFDVKAQLAGV